MNITADLPAVRKAITALKPFAKGRNLPVLSGVLIEAGAGSMTLTATDLDCTARTTVLCETAAEGRALVHLLDLEKLLKGKGRIELAIHDDDNLRVVNGLTTKLRRLPADEFPKLSTSFGEYGPAFPQDLAALASVLPAASTDENRPILTGVLFEKGGRVVATDSYRLHYAQQLGELDDLHEMLVPRWGLAPVVKHGGPATIRQHSKGHFVSSVLIEAGTMSWEVRCIEGEFPNYRQLLRGSSPLTVMVARPAFDNALTEIAKAAKSSVSPVRLHEGSPVKVTLFEQDRFDIEVEVEGFAGCNVAFNPKYLLDLITGIDGCTFGVVDALKPAELRCTDAEGRDHVRILMPVRV